MPHVLLISGSTRGASTNSALLRTAAALDPDTTFYEDLADLPHFNPDDDHEPLPPPVADLRARIAEASAVLFCTPEYAGTLPGSFKNLLDWMVGGTQMTDKPSAWVNASADPRRGHGASETLAGVLSYVQARVVEAACRSVPIAREMVVDGLVDDQATQAAMRDVLQTLRAAASAEHDQR